MQLVWISNLSNGQRLDVKTRRITLLIAVVQEVSISNSLCAPYLRLCGRFNLSTKFIKGHILLHITGFISLTQTYYAPGWRWPYESHKAILVNMIVKADAQYGLRVQREGHLVESMHRKNVCLQRCLWCSIQTAVIDLLQPNRLLPATGGDFWGWISVCYGTELTRTHSLVKDLFSWCCEVGNTKSPWLWNSIIRTQFWNYSPFWLHCRYKLSVLVTPHVKVNKHWHVAHEFCSSLLPVHLTSSIFTSEIMNRCWTFSIFLT